MIKNCLEEISKTGKHPALPCDAELAAERRKKVYSLYEDGYAFIVGNTTKEMEFSDYEVPFRQYSTFRYVTGSTDQDCACILDFKKKEIHYLTPFLPASYAVWLGKIESLDEIKARHKCDYVHYMKDLVAVWGSLEPGVVRVISEEAKNACKAPFDKGFTIDTEELQYGIGDCRRIKLPHEVMFMYQSAANLKEAVVKCMKKVKSFTVGHQLAGVIAKQAYTTGTEHHSFHTIVAVGKSASTLHYVSHDNKLEEGTTVLLDCGIEYKQYASDCTRTFPCRGKYNEEQRKAYEIVLRANKECIDMCKPGVNWEDVHAHALLVILEGLRENGLVKKDASIEEQLKLDVPNIFMPHGLGHLLGLDAHDAGGYAKGVEHIPRISYSSLRFRRVLEPGMAVTVEPGLYFVPPLIEEAMKDERGKHYNLDRIREWSEKVGGIRIEDDVIITEDGHFVLPAAPKDCDAMLALINGE